MSDSNTKNQGSKVEKLDSANEDKLMHDLQAILLAEDLRKGRATPHQELAKALYMKLEHFAFLGIEDFLAEASNEVTDSYQALIGSVLGDTAFNLYQLSDPEQRKEIMKGVLEKIQDDPTHKLLMSRLAEANRDVRLCREYIEQNDGINEVDGDEFGKLLIDVLNSLNKLRVTHDVIPLLERGLYSSEVQATLDFWHKTRDEAEAKKEGVWQKELSERQGVLQRALGGSVFLFQPQAHVGSDGLNGRGDRITDFLCRHSGTTNVFLVEIKTPETPLLGKAYRNTYALSEEVSGTISQVLLQRHDAMVNYLSKHYSSAVDFTVAAPRCIVIAGRIDKEIASDKEKRLAFEMQRQAIESNVRIISFDELYADFANFHVLKDRS